MKAISMYGYDYKSIQKRRRRQAIQRRRSLEATNMVMVCNKIFYIVALICMVLAIFTMATCILMRQYYQNILTEKDTEISELQAENDDLMSQINDFSTTYNETVALLEDVSEIAYNLDNENEQLIVQSNELQSKINTYEKREELFDKYEWAIMRSDNTRTDITYDRITSLEELVDEKNLSDDCIDLVLSIAMSESSGNEKAYNPNSTARGFGQLLEGTARFTYETLMKNGKGSYNHNMAFDGDLNIAMMTYYLDYLGVKYSDNISLVLKEYRGKDDPSHDVKLNKYLAKAGTSLYSIALRP